MDTGEELKFIYNSYIETTFNIEYFHFLNLTDIIQILGQFQLKL